MTAIHLLVTAEGQTEQKFVKDVLAPYLGERNIFTEARCVLTSKDKRASKEFRGGLLSYEKAKNDIEHWMKERRGGVFFTTMFDLYALPNDFPGFNSASDATDPYHKVNILEHAMAEDIGDSRFVPYIQLHEFETLVLADPEKLDWEYLEHDIPIANLKALTENKNPELINDSKESAPSKRILHQIPEYDKVTAGVAVVKRIGLENLRSRCRHFNEWINRLENLTE